MPSVQEVEEAQALIEKLKAQKTGGNTVVNDAFAKPSPWRGTSVAVYPRVINGKEASFVVTPLELSVPPTDNKGVYARKVRVDLTRGDCGIQSRTIVFEDPAVVKEEGVFVKVPRGRGIRRFRPDEFQLFDPMLVFSGNIRDRKLLKALRIRPEILPK